MDNNLRNRIENNAKFGEMGLDINRKLIRLKEKRMPFNSIKNSK